MSIQPWQLIDFAVFLMAIVTFANMKSNKGRAIIIVLAIAITVANPFRFKQEGMVSIERLEYEQKEIPEKVIIESLNYEEFHQQKAEKLKRESKEIHEEIN